MDKNAKIIIAIVCAAIVLVCVGVGVSTVGNNSGNGDTLTVSPTEDKTVAPSTTESQQTTESMSAVTTTIPAATLSDQLIGKWMDSAGMSGYEFFTDGRVAITYANLEGFDIPFNGTAQNGIYTVEDNKVTIKYSIYTATIETKYEAKIEGDILYLKDLEDLETGVYQRVRGETETTQDTTVTTTQGTTLFQPTTSAQSSEGDLIGSWTNTEKGTKYHFKIDGTVYIYLNDVVIPSLGTEKISTTLVGTYTVSGNILTVQYELFGTAVTSKYSFSVENNTLRLTDESGESIIFSRAGTSFSPVDEDEILGVWRDGADMSGYEFKENGIVKITFVNLTIPVVDIPINGTFTGSYEIEGNEITINYSVYGATISSSYTYEIKGNVLSMTSTDDGNLSTYIKK